LLTGFPFKPTALKELANRARNLLKYQFASRENSNYLLFFFVRLSIYKPFSFVEHEPMIDLATLAVHIAPF
jgi:hypothetical protein